MIVMDQQTENCTQIGFFVLPIRFVLGWIFWGGGSRRFIYAPSKLDPHSSTWLANKLQSAMPGALLGTNHIISLLLQHFWLLYFFLIVFSLLELLSGLGLILGCFTRLCASVTFLLSITLMLSFGWEGGSCMDEWTMAVSAIAMSAVLILSGSPAFSIDELLRLENKPFLQFATSAELPKKILTLATVVLTLFTIIFTTVTYNYYRGSIYSHYHSGPVSPTHFTMKVTSPQLLQSGSLSFNLTITGGTSSVPAYIMKMELLDNQNRIVERWPTTILSNLTSNQIINKYQYNKIEVGPYGLVAPESAQARITLPSTIANRVLEKGNYILKLYFVDGRITNTIINMSP